LTEDVAKTIPEEDLLMVNRNKRIETINSILEEECKKYNVDFCNIFPLITKEYKLIKLFSLGKYSRYNIHHRYEYLLIIFIKMCLKFLIKDRDFDKIVDELKSVYNDYIKNRIYDDSKEKHTEKTKEEKDALYKKTKFSKKKILKFVNDI
jgi:hypothetical protein